MIMASQSTAAINILSEVTVRVMSINNRILSDAFGVSTGSQLGLISILIFDLYRLRKMTAGRTSYKKCDAVIIVSG